MTFGEMQHQITEMGVEISMQKKPGTLLWTARIKADLDGTSVGLECVGKDPESAMKGVLAKLKHQAAPSRHGRFEG